MDIDLLGLIPAFFFALSSIFTRKGLDYSTPQTGSFIVLQTQFSLFAFSLFFVDFSQFTITYSLLFFIFAGLSSPALSLLFLFLSINRIGVARTNAISNTHAIFGALSAFFILGERPSLHVWIGIILVVIGIVFISGGGKNAMGRSKFLILPLISAMCFGLAHALRKNGIESHTSLLFAGFVQGLSASIFGPIFLKMSNKWEPFVFNLKSNRNFLLSGIAMAFAQFSLLFALSRSEVYKVSPLVATVPLFTLFLAPLILGDKEKITLPVIASSIIIVIGVVLVTIRFQF